MLEKFIGSRGLVFLVVDKADKDEDGWAALSYQDIANETGCLFLNSVKYTADQMAKHKIIEKKSQGTTHKNLWRVNPSLYEMLEKHYGVEASNENQNKARVVAPVVV